MQNEKEWTCDVIIPMYILQNINLEYWHHMFFYFCVKPIEVKYFLFIFFNVEDVTLYTIIWQEVVFEIFDKN